MTERIRSLHVIRSFSRGGIETWLKNAMLSSSGSVLDIDVCCTGPNVGPLAEEVRRAGRCVRHVPWKRKRSTVIKELRNLFAQGGYDVVHWHTDKAIEPVARAARSANVPLIVTVHNTDFCTVHSRKLSRLMKWGARPLVNAYVRRNLRVACTRASLVTGVSQSVLESLARFTKLTPSRWKVFVLGVAEPKGSSVDTNRLRLDLVGDTDSPLILHVGRFARQKNHTGILDVIKNLLQRLPNARLCLVGTGCLVEGIKTYARELGMADHVLFLGERDDVFDLMHAADAFFLPSFHEGLPITIMEAFACGVPVVASRVAGNTDAIRDKENGVLCKLGDNEAFADALQRVLEDASWARTLSEGGKATFQEKFSMSGCLVRMEDMYRKLIQSPNARQQATSRTSMTGEAAAARSTD